MLGGGHAIMQRVTMLGHGLWRKHSDLSTLRRPQRFPITDESGALGLVLRIDGISGIVYQASLIR